MNQRPRQQNPPRGQYRDRESFPELNFVLSEDPNELNRSAEEWGKRWSRLEAKTPSSQVRKFYQEVKRLEQLIENDGWDKHRLEFKLLKAKAAYQLRQKPAERKDLVKFIQEAADKVNASNFQLFFKYFEAAVGYAYGFGLKDKD